MPDQWQMWLRHLVFMSYLLFGDSSSQLLCPLDGLSDYVTAVCFGHLQSHSPLVNWTLSAPGQGDNLEGQITCHTLHERCTQSVREGLEASVTASGKAFISVATFRKLDGQERRYVTCSAWSDVGDNSAPGTILCDTAVPNEWKIERCADMLPTEPSSGMLCDRTGTYCGIYERTGNRATRSTNSTRGDARNAGDAGAVVLKSVCKSELTSRRFKRYALGTNTGKPARRVEIHGRIKRSAETDNCTPVIRVFPSKKIVQICYEVTERDVEIKCQNPKTNADLNFTCYMNVNISTNISFQFDHNVKTSYYDKLSCHCFVDQTSECKKSHTYVGFTFSYRNQTCKSSEDESTNTFSLFYIFAGVLSVYCFIFVSATCAFICKHGAGLYSYYYLDLYRKMKMELTHQNNPPLPPPRLPPRRLTACSVNAERNAPGVAVRDESTGCSDDHADNEPLFATHSHLQRLRSGQVPLPPAPQVGDSGELLDDGGYLVPKSLSLPCHRTGAAASSLHNSTPRRLHSFKKTWPRITGNGLPPPLPCKRQDGNNVVSELKCALYHSSDSVSSASSSLDSDGSLSIHSVDDYT